MNEEATISLLEAELEMERAARFSAEKKLREQQLKLNELAKPHYHPGKEKDIFFQPSFVNKITEHLQIGVLIENESNLVINLNTAFCSFFNIHMSPNTLLGVELLQPHIIDQNRFANYHTFLQRTYEILNNRLEVRGDIVAFKSGVVLERDYIPIIEQDEYKGHIWYYTNCTEKNNWEKKLQSQKTIYENILSSMPADIAVFNPEHADLLLNPIAIKDEELRKWVIEWMIGKQNDQNHQSTNWEDVGNYKSLFKKVVQEKKPGSIEEQRKNEEGTTEYFLKHLYPILDNNDELKMIIGYNTNITNRVLAEQEILKAKQLSEETARLKEVFLANMSHEIRTPLNGISGLSQLLYKTKLTPKQSKLLSLLQKTTSELGSIVNDILLFEKIAAGQHTFEKLAFYPMKQMSETLAPFRIKAREKGIYIRFNKNKANTCVLGDPLRLAQILNNLISNAIKFTEKGGITITANEKLLNNQLLLQIDIRDTGIGIAKEKINQIFSPFIQAEANITRRYGGTGLGLSIVKSLITLQGGSIHVASTPGKGSTFTVHIPYQLANDSTEESKGIISHNKLLLNKHILVAEDVELNSFITQSLLEEQGAMVTVVTDGKMAVDSVSKHSYDLILMDISMPIMDGITATKKIRSIEKWKGANIPIIALTANALPSDTNKYLLSGMQGHLVKPFSERQLLETIAAVLKDHENRLADPPFQSPNSYFIDRPELAAKMSRIFIDTAPVDCDQLLHAIQSKNLPAVNKLAHRMKSSIDGMGITCLKQPIRQLEKISKHATEISDIEHLVTHIRSTILNVVSHLETEFPKLEQGLAKK